MRPKSHLVQTCSKNIASHFAMCSLEKSRTESRHSICGFPNLCRLYGNRQVRPGEDATATCPKTRAQLIPFVEERNWHTNTERYTTASGSRNNKKISKSLSHP